MASKNATTVFAEVTLTKNGVAKGLDDGSVSVDSKAIYLGKRGNWRFPWKNIERLEFSGSRSLSVTCANGDNFECFDAEPDASYRAFSTIVEKQWDKRHGKREAPVEAVSVRRPSSRRRKTYGSSRGPRSRMSMARSRMSMAHSTAFSSDDEQETRRESWREEPDVPPPKMPSLDDQDDATLHESTSPFEQPEKRGRTKRRLEKTREDDNDDSDEDVFDGPDLTTPAAKRLVSPAFPTPVVEESETTTKEDVAPKGKSTITSFFGVAPAKKKDHEPHASPEKTKMITKSPLTPTRPLKRNNEWLNTPSAPRSARKRVLREDDEYISDNESDSVTRPLKQNTEWLHRPSAPRSARKRDLQDADEDITDIESDGAASPARNSTYSFVPNKENAPEESDVLENTPPSHNRRKDFFRRHSKGLRRGFHSSTGRLSIMNSADRALAVPSSRKKVVNRYKGHFQRSPLVDAIPKNPWRGLRNLGNTCYLNSSLQMLFSVPSFVSSLAGKGGDLAKSIVSVWGNLKDNPAIGAANPNSVKKAIDNVTDKFVGYEQRDAHEFLSDLVDRVHDELEEETKENGTPDGGESLPTDEYFRLTVQVSLTCDSCGYTRTKEELYRHLSLEIQDHHDLAADGDKDTSTEWSIQRALERFFEPEKREVKCEKCEHGTSATQTMCISSCSKALLLHLKRFAIVKRPVASAPPSDENDENSPETTEEQQKRPPAVELTVRKNKAPVVIDESVSLSPFIAANDEKESGSQETRDTTYDLKSIVRHIGGTAMSGHYTADSIRESSNKENGPTDEWVSFDDGITSLTTADDVMKEKKSRKSAYMLLYALHESS